MLSTAALEKIDIEIAKYPAEQKQSAVMAALAIAQKEMRWLSPETLKFIAEYLKMPAVWVQEVATFYNMYHTKPVGEFVINVCTNLPCALSGGEDTFKAIADELNLDAHAGHGGATTLCGKFTLKESECMGACGDAPVLLVNNEKMHSFICVDKARELLKALRENKEFMNQPPAQLKEVNQHYN
jgi:NADH-quinone oxidoreductase E subunit